MSFWKKWFHPYHTPVLWWFWRRHYALNEVRENSREFLGLSLPRLFRKSPKEFFRLYRHEVDEHRKLVHRIREIDRKRDLGVLTCVFAAASSVPCEGQIKEWATKPEIGENGKTIRYGLNMALCTAHAVELDVLDSLGMERKDD